jgi:hypothetical protein
MQSGEQDHTVFNNILTVLDEHSDLNGIYLTCYSIDGVVNALKSRNLKRQVRIICHVTCISAHHSFSPVPLAGTGLFFRKFFGATEFLVRL